MGVVSTTFLLSSAILKNNDGKILFLKRSEKNTTFVGHWQFLEGKVEFGEHPEKALVREIKEETGLVVQPLSLKLVSSWTTTVSDKEYQLVRIIYEATCKGEINLTDEHDAFCWASVDEAKNLEPKIGGLAEILGDLRK